VVAYKVICEIKADDITAIHFSMQGGHSFEGFPATLNGRSLGRFGEFDGQTGYNGQINKGDNSFELDINGDSYNSEPYLNSGAYIDFLNLDNSVSETVSCSATPIMTKNRNS
jgi:hypothetical protein